MSDALSTIVAGTAAAAAKRSFEAFSQGMSEEKLFGRKRMKATGVKKRSKKSIRLFRAQMVPNSKTLYMHLNGDYGISEGNVGGYFDIRYNDLHHPMNTGYTVTSMSTAVNGTPAVAAHGYYGLNLWLGAGKFYDSYRVYSASLKITVQSKNTADVGDIVIIPIKTYQGTTDSLITTSVAAKDTGWAKVCPFAQGKVCVLRASSTISSLFGLGKAAVEGNEKFQARYGAQPINEGLFRVFISNASGGTFTAPLCFSVELVVKCKLFNSDEGQIGSTVV